MPPNKLTALAQPARRDPCPPRTKDFVEA